MKFAIDLDNVTFDFIGACSRLLGRDPVNWNGVKLSSMYSIPSKISDKLVFTASTYWLAKPLPYSITSLKKLSELPGLDIEIEYVTARPTSLQEATLNINRLYRLPNYKNLTLLGGTRPKIDYILANNFDVVLDDSERVVKGVANKVKFPYIFTRPWNSNLEWEFRVNGWKEFVERFIQ